MLTNLHKTIWSEKLLEGRLQAGVLRKIANKEYQGEISGKGSKVKITSIVDPTIGTYTPGVALTVTDAQDSAVELAIDNYAYFNEAFDKADMRLTDIPYMAQYAVRAGLKLQLKPEATIAGLYSGAGSTVANVDVNSANITSVLSGGKVKLERAANLMGVPMFLAVAPEVYEKMKLAKILLATDNAEVLARGAVGQWDGMDVFVSNDIVKSGDYYKCMMGSYRAIAYVDAMTDLDEILDQTNPKVVLQQMLLFGAKVIVASELCSFSLKPVIETTI